MSSDQEGQWKASIGNAVGLDETKASQTDTPTAINAAPHGSEWKNKAVLLVDINPRTRDSRAKMLRSFGVKVQCVPSASTALLQLTSETYNLVLVDLGRDIESAESLAQEIKTRNPRQLVAFLIGSPLYLAASPRTAGNGQQRSPVAAVKPPVAKTSTHTGTAIDFGQKIRDAEAEAAS